LLGAIDRVRVVLVNDAICSSADQTHDALIQLYRSRFSERVEADDAGRPRRLVITDLLEDTIMKALFRDNGLTIALLGMFVSSGLGMIWSGHAAYNEELQDHSAAAVGVLAYLVSGDFLSALFENWESEFLQMSAYVMLTAMLYQRGSAESRDPDDPKRPGDELPAAMRRRSPILSWLYSYSLGIALAALFLASFALHWWASLAATNEEALRHGDEVQSLGRYLLNTQLWFESFQNWQSEFMSTAVLVVLSIFLRHKGSPESKPAAAANDETGA
jgi:hypothetical protein